MPGTPPVVLLSYTLWQSHFGGDRNVVGQSIRLDDRPFTVAGVLPPNFRWLERGDVVEPIGVWATEQNKGNVRVEQCGANLCGYAEKTNERILINMKPDGAKWSGRIHDPDSGRNYDSTIAMKGPNALRVQGCAFGGMFCGGQTWTRAN